MTSHRYVLPNGFRVHLVPFAGTEAATVYVLFKVGSRYEYEEINGAAHYIEHLMFKGTKRRPSTTDISKALDGIGAEYNAFTSKSWTGYYIKAEASHLPLAVDMLHDMTFNSVYDKKEMDRERGVIVEEINMYRDNPMMRIEELLEERMFEGPLGWNIGGTEHTMRTMPREKVLAFRDTYYTPDRAVIVVAGKVTKTLLNDIKKTFGSVKPRKGDAPNEYLASRLRDKDLDLRLTVEQKDTKQIQIAMGFPSYAIGDKRNYAVALLANILGGTMSSRLFIQVRERKGLCYFIRSSNGPMEDVGVFTVQSGLEAARLPLAIKTIKQEITLMAKKGVTAKELKEAKENIRGRLMLSMEDSSDRADWFASQELFQDSVKTPAEHLTAMAKVTPAQVKAVAKDILNLKRMTLAAIGPFANESEFRKKAGL
jgi:predicted Zn-dependent peptidase